jgi:hypothetical protein
MTIGSFYDEGDRLIASLIVLRRGVSVSVPRVIFRHFTNSDGGRRTAPKDEHAKYITEQRARGDLVDFTLTLIQAQRRHHCLPRTAFRRRCHTDDPKERPVCARGWRGIRFTPLGPNPPIIEAQTKDIRAFSV